MAVGPGCAPRPHQRERDIHGPEAHEAVVGHHEPEIHPLRVLVYRSTLAATATMPEVLPLAPVGRRLVVGGAGRGQQAEREQGGEGSDRCHADHLPPRSPVVSGVRVAEAGVGAVGAGLEVLEHRQDVERRHRALGILADLDDLLGIGLAEEPSGLAHVPDPRRI